MKMQTFLNSFDRLYASNVNLMLLGAPGMGKTTAVEAEARKRGLGYVELVLSQIEGVDLRGIMVPIRQADGSTPDTGSTLTPLKRMIQQEIDAGAKGGIVGMDEYFQGPLDVRKAATNFLVSKRIGEWTLPDGWVIWGTSNPPEWRAGTSNAMGHEVSRWMMLNVTPDPESWERWAYSQGVHHLYLTWANRFPHEVFSEEPPKDRNAPHCNPRSLMAAHAIHTLGSKGNDLSLDGTMREFVAGAIGAGAAESLFGFLAVQDVLPSPEEMLANPEGCRLPPPERLDAHYAAMMQAVTLGDRKTNDTLFKYVQRMGKDMAVTCIRHMAKKDKLAVSSPAIAKFIAENPEAVMSIAERA